MTAYFEALCEAMALVSAPPNAVVLGQAVRFPGTAMYTTLRDVPMEKRVEMPVAENMQMGMSTGIALAGGLPITLFPRWNFLLEATSQLVSHLDRLPIYSNGGHRPKVIIRTAVATDQPLDPGVQHVGDFSAAYAAMLRTVRVVQLRRAEKIVPEYRTALECEGSTLLVEYTSCYDD